MSQVSDLKKILDHDADLSLLKSKIEASQQLADTQEPSKNNDDFCIECNDQKAALFCLSCEEAFCEVCFQIVHRAGKRKTHQTRSFLPEHILEQVSDSNPDPNLEQAHTTSTPDEKQSTMHADQIDFNNLGNMITAQNQPDFTNWIINRAKHIPLRLTPKERKYMRLLEATLNVSEYTDKIDILLYGDKVKRVVGQIQEICALLSGLLLASDYKAGQALFEDRQFDENSLIFQKIFEIGRRYKIMNPQKMRNTYGKLMYMLQDSVSPEVQQILGFNLVLPIKNVYDVLKSYGAEHVLEDPYIAVATQEIIPEEKPRSQIQMQIKQKEKAIEYLSRNYCTSSCNQELIRQCLYSISDNHAFLRYNRDPCDKMLSFLIANFDPTSAESNELSLSITSGYDGARLSHSHSNQYYYVFQTLTLWREILHELYMLWNMADDDLLSYKNYYRLRDTGQGLNRVQQCPRVSRAVHTILNNVQKKTQKWIGSSVIHLGDKNVPNAFMFIDKYNQIAMFLNPIVKCVDYINDLEATTKPSTGLANNPIKQSPDGSSDENLDKNASETNNLSAKSRLQSVLSGKFSLNPFEMLSSIDGNRKKSKGRNLIKDSDIDKNAIRAYVDYAFGGPTVLRKLILSDFFRHGFDGSGADNFFDAGSCIDGRLTSSWNWCSQIEKKVYFPIFLLSGFVGFNGEPDVFG
ncbi:hypothetical protein BB561_002799 [Smittium simulii]|uniref:B box-type domain-containing protein n=1 Tax=Smittium simulii TaxID=133385 RepID=A0A2T9YP34_9FUNG|nr:hypothetical protein BB561_002799 [Smittium simulii]